VRASHIVRGRHVSAAVAAAGVLYRMVYSLYIRTTQAAKAMVRWLRQPPSPSGGWYLAECVLVGISTVGGAGHASAQPASAAVLMMSTCTGVGNARLSWVGD
jgi:hypothetical protein